MLRSPILILIYSQLYLKAMPVHCLAVEKWKEWNTGFHVGKINDFSERDYNDTKSFR